MDQQAQTRAINTVATFRADYDSKCKKRKGQLKEIYDEVMDFFPPKEQDWDSSLKVNFINQREHLVASKITAKAPKPIVSIQQNPVEIIDDYDVPEEAAGEFARQIMNDWAPAIQKYLSMIFQNAKVQSTLRRAAKQLVRTGNLYGKAAYTYDVYREKEKKDGKYKITEKVTNQYPCIKLLSLQELYIDPRYTYTEEMPAVIWRHERVRLTELQAMKEQEGMMNLDKIKYAPKGDINPDKNHIYEIMIDNTYGEPTKCKTLTVDEYYGYFSTDGKAENETLYEIWVLNDSLVVRCRPITQIPIKSAACFEDPEQHFGVGFAEAMIGLQKEYNFKMNSAIEYINFNLNHTFLWDPNSGINPQTLMYANAPKGIIPATKGMEAATEGLKELERRPMDPNYFSNQNEIRGDMETVSFSINALNSGVRPGSSETATGIKATYYDSNIVMSVLMRQFEEWLSELCYDMLDQLVENYEDDKIVLEIGQGHYEWIDKEVFRKSKLRYSIKIDIGSSSFDSQENRREDALAKLTILERAQQMGIEPDMRKGIEDILSTFENVSPDDYLGGPPDPMKELMKNMPKMPGMPELPQGAPMPGEMNMGSFGNMMDTPPDLSQPNEQSQAVVGNIIPDNPFM